MVRRHWKKALAAGTLAVLAGCGTPAHDAKETYYLVATNIELPYWQSAKSGLEAAAARYKVKAELVGPTNYSPQEQVAEFRRVAARKPAGILVSAATPALMKPEIDSAVAAGIPVVTLDADVPDSRRHFFVGTNNYLAGEMGGRALAERLGGKGNVVVMTMPNQKNLAERLDGYRSALATHPGIRITQVVDIKGDPTVAFDAAADVIRARPKEVDAFVCLEASACKEVAELVSREKATGKTIIAMDTDAATLDWIEKGVIAATVAQKPYTMAFYGLKAVDDLHHQGTQQAMEMPSLIDTGASLVTKANLPEFRQQGKPGT